MPHRSYPGLDPSAVAARFHPDDHPPALQRLIELLRLSRGMLQLALHVLPSLGVQHCDALKTRMKITTTPYNVHLRLLSSRVLVLRKNSSLLGFEREPLVS